MTAADLFLRPGALPLLALAPLVAVVLWALDRRRERRLLAFAGPRLAALAPTRSPALRSARRALFVAGLLCATAALAEPVWGASDRALAQRGADVVVCLDVSRSMLARDQAPDRLGAARREIRSLAAHAQGDRMALVAFAGEPRVLSPLTRDLASVVELADAADPLSVSRGGTDLGAALLAALDLLETRGDAPGVVVLLTDGEDHAGRGEAAAASLRSRGVVVHCVALGSERGSKITVPGDRGEQFLTDRSGAPVVSSMDAASLRRVSAAGGGEFVASAQSDDALGVLYDRSVAPLARASVAPSDPGDATRRRASRFEWPLLAGFLLWILDLCLTDRRRS